MVIPMFNYLFTTRLKKKKREANVVIVSIRVLGSEFITDAYFFSTEKRVYN